MRLNNKKGDIKRITNFIFPDSKRIETKGYQIYANILNEINKVVKELEELENNLYGLKVAGKTENLKNLIKGVNIITDKFDIKRKSLLNLFNNSFSSHKEPLWVEDIRNGLKSLEYSPIVNISTNIDLFEKNVEKKKVLFESAQKKFLSVKDNSYAYFSDQNEELKEFKLN